MKIAILGSGGREHALAHSIYNSKKTKKIFCLPGNAGTAEIAENVEVDINNFGLIQNFIEEKNIDLVIVGPEKPLVNGIVDFLEKKIYQFLVLNVNLLSWKDQKFSQNTFVKNTIYQQQNLVFSRHKT